MTHTGEHENDFTAHGYKHPTASVWNFGACAAGVRGRGLMSGAGPRQVRLRLDLKSEGTHAGWVSESARSGLPLFEYRPPRPGGRSHRKSVLCRARKVLGWPKKMQVGPCIPAGIQL